jgi:hypothetical protein
MIEAMIESKWSEPGYWLRYASAVFGERGWRVSGSKLISPSGDLRGRNPGGHQNVCNQSPQSGLRCPSQPG